ncbi:hypothetical protein [Parapedobacter sp. 2B3]|uniref:hypothetical protein n=1 Tax=Parapedobacter sp. 2B3 TaxID=3342381 RepID=UPI0035B63976
MRTVNPYTRGRSRSAVYMGTGAADRLQAAASLFWADAEPSSDYPAIGRCTAEVSGLPDQVSGLPDQETGFAVSVGSNRAPLSNACAQPAAGGKSISSYTDNVVSAVADLVINAAQRAGCTQQQTRLE